MKRLSNILLSALLLGVGCTKHSSFPSKEPVIKIGSDVLTAKALAEKLSLRMKPFDAAAAKLTSNSDMVKNNIIHEFLVSVVVKNYAQKNGISISDQEFEQAFDKIRKGYSSDLEFKASLAHSGLLVEDWKRDFKSSLLERKVFEKVTTEPNPPSNDFSSEAKAYYQSHLSQYTRPTEARVSQIVVAKQEEIDKIRNLIKNHTYTFEELAKKYSLSPDASSGGDIGYISKGAVPAFDVAFNLPIGQLSNVIKSSYGYHLLKVTNRKPATKISFEQARAGIIKLLEDEHKQNAFSNWLIDELKKYKVEKNQALIDKIKVFTEGSYE